MYEDKSSLDYYYDLVDSDGYDDLADEDGYIDEDSDEYLDRLIESNRKEYSKEWDEYLSENEPVYPDGSLDGFQIYDSFEEYAAVERFTNRVWGNVIKVNGPSDQWPHCDDSTLEEDGELS